jgi:outer membrane protein
MERSHGRHGLRGAALILALLTPGGLAAQAPATLTLDEAHALARRHNPDFLGQQNNALVADWAVRDAYGALLPGATASSTVAYQGAGTQRIGIFTGDDLGLGATTSYYSSSYSLGLSYSLSGAALMAPGRERASRRATEAGIEAAAFNLDASVTRQYLAVKRAEDGVVLARQELERAEDNRRLAQARVDVGAAIPLDAKQAEVEKGRAEVALLQAENLVRTEKLRLVQLLGIDLDRDVELTTVFRVADVPWTADELRAAALAAHPALQAARAQERAAATGVRMARSRYLPSLSVQAGVSGFTRQAGNTGFLIDQARARVRGQRAECLFLNDLSARLVSPLPDRPEDCSAITLTPEMERRIREGNSVFPFDFTREPLGASLTVSLPVFQGFQRERQIEEARVAEQDARHRTRSEELRLRTEIATAHLNLETARRSVALEERNRELAEDQAVLARERYRVGAGTFLELQDAETVKARAERAYLTAVYQFHEALAALEAAVGRPLRPAGGG